MTEITEKDLADLDNPTDGWYVIEAAGDHPTTATVGGQSIEFIQHLTPEVLARIAEAGVPAEGLLVDRDHFSSDLTKPTEACGWVRELALCHGNLAARIEWTPLGLPLIQGKIYRHFSTTYPRDEEAWKRGSYEPSQLLRLALTNLPNNRAGQPPITNRAPEPGGATPLAAAPGSDTQTNTHTMTTNPKLLAALGLADGASEDEIIAAAEAMAAKAARCEQAETTAEQAVQAETAATIAAAESEAGVTLAPEEKEEATEALLNDRRHGQRFLTLLCNSRRAATPATRRYGDQSRHNSSALNNRQPVNPAAGINQRAHELCRAAAAEGRSLSYTAARALAARELNS